MGRRVNRVSDAEFKRVQAYIEVVEGVRYQWYILDQYLDGTVDGYTRQQCQDEDPDELRCDACRPDGPDEQTLTPSPAASAAPASECDVEISDLPNDPPNARNQPVALDSRSRSMSETSDILILSQVPRSAAVAPSPKALAPTAAVSTVPADGATPAQYQRAALRQQAATVQWGLDCEFLEQKARRWLHQCYVCTVTGYNSDHELYNYHYPDSQSAKQ
ncbi:hypothetical protein DTO166G4_8671 [Paecilomyces variotii]|nr:hypothetical protein DTO166G4_8671 [Paecilomyces variotii]KAJ9228750.1 hypothetical protein DTO166G5_8348 [Paecilomyces variotii]